MLHLMQLDSSTTTTIITIYYNDVHIFTKTLPI